MSNLIIIDLDGTLIPITGYAEANGHCVGILKRVFGRACPRSRELVRRYHVIDIPRMEQHEFSLERFPQSWGLVYLNLCDQLQVEFDQNIHQELLVAAGHFQDGPFIAYPGAIEALTKLQRERYEIQLVTSGRGGESLQHRKVDEAGLRPFFPRSRMIITGIDKSGDFRALITANSNGAWVIGDSPKHDIAPGKAAGARTVLVEGNSWTYTESEVEPDYRIKTFNQVVNLLPLSKP